MKKIKTEFRYCVYKHIVPNGRIYIGSTGQEPKDRWKKGRGYKANTPFWKDIQKYGWNNIEHIIIASGLGENTARNMEKDLIRFTIGKIGLLCYNQKDGGITRDEGTNKYRESKREYKRKRRAEDPAYREAVKERMREYNRKRYAEDPAYREYQREYKRKRRAEDPAYREAKRKKMREYQREYMRKRRDERSNNINTY